MLQTVQTIQTADDENKFKNLYLEFYPRLFIFSKTILKEKAPAEDAVEDVFLKLWENRQMLPTIKNLSYYLFVAVKHTCLNALKKQKRISSIAWDDLDPEFCFSVSDPETEMLSKENLRLIEEALNNLPPKCRLIFYMVKEEQLKYREIAEILDLSVKTVEAQMTIALRKISDRLSRSLPLEMARIVRARI